MTSGRKISGASRWEVSIALNQQDQLTMRKYLAGILHQDVQETAFSRCKMLDLFPARISPRDPRRCHPLVYIQLAVSSISGIPELLLACNLAARRASPFLTLAITWAAEQA